ncbi:MAG: pyrroline-5-carboxylate reductase [Muribaculaceae bacterium]
MKIGIIGAGNMGGSIARGLACSGVLPQGDITVCDPSVKVLEAIKSEYNGVNVSTDNAQAVADADVVIVAVKPWLLDVVMQQLNGKIDFGKQMLVSVVAGATLQHLASFAGEQSASAAVFRLIPNIAISVRRSMTFIAHQGATPAQVAAVCGLFDALGSTMVIEERIMGACTALSSCGIAYVMRYIRAACEGGVELGLYPGQALEIMLQTMAGAVDLLRATGNHPEVEIDRVTTPGGITIKGLNEMEENGFTRAVIAGLKASAK